MNLKKYLLLSLLFLVSSIVSAQQASKKDTAFVNKILQESKTFVTDDTAKAISLAKQAKEISAKIHYPRGEAYALKNLGMAYYTHGMFIETLDYWSQSLKIFELINDDVGSSNLLNNIAAIYFDQGVDAKALEYSLKSLKLAEKTKDSLRIFSALSNVGAIYHNKKDPVAINYLSKALSLCEALRDKENYVVIAGNLGEVYFDNNNDAKALEYYQKAIKADNSSFTSAFAFNGIGKIYLKRGSYEQALKNHETALLISQKIDDKLQIIRSLRCKGDVYTRLNDLTQAFNNYNKAMAIAEAIKANFELKDLYYSTAKIYAEKGDYKRAYQYQQKYVSVKDTLYNIETAQKLGKLQFDFDISKKEGEIQLLTNEKSLREAEIKTARQARTTLSVGMALVLMITIVAIIGYRNKRKANAQLQQQKEEIQNTLTKLKETQNQLVQAEKMASLGELTAGIAHEIQNPLNFVNNFSDLSKGLVDEMGDALQNDDREEAISIGAEIKENLKKINHHGSRADAIVKGMLLHSRGNTGKREPVDINALADESLRLSYHGLRAKDKSFNAEFKTDFDKSLSKINVVPGDIGRVLLNLLNNAFYSVNEKKKQLNQAYQPVVSVTTRAKNSPAGAKGLEIIVKDNGTGIPEKVVDKIYQPFFTTKPAGQGTGLGLSLSYDIIKAHMGELKLDTTEGEGAEFTIFLPIN